MVVIEVASRALGRGVVRASSLTKLTSLTTLTTASIVLCCSLVEPAFGERLARELLSIDLPGAPASVIAADLDRDGHADLVVVVAYAEWSQTAFDEQVDEPAEIEGDPIVTVVDVMTVVPSIADRRELLVYRGLPQGGFAEWVAAQPLPSTVLALMEGPVEQPVIALTAEGVAALRIDAQPESGGVAARAHVRFESILERRSVLAGSASLLTDLELTPDLDGDGERDLLVPLRDAFAVYLSSDGRLGGEQEGLLRQPRRARVENHGPRARHYPLPQMRDVDGDSIPDALFLHPSLGYERFWVARGLGGGRFEDPREPLGDERELGDPIPGIASAHDRSPSRKAPSRGAQSRSDAEASDEGGEQPSDWGSGDSEPAPLGLQGARVRVAWFGDLDGDGLAEYVTSEDQSDSEVGVRKVMRQVKNPPFRYRVHGAARPSLVPLPLIRGELDAVGYALGTGDELPLPGGFRDLDGDRRHDLVTVTLDFSLLQAVRILATQTLSVGLGFNVYCQEATGAFSPVEGLDLSGKFRLDLDDLKLGQLSAFAGDFDGDGRADFVQIGRGRRVTIHLGQDGCRYAAQPDLVIQLRDEPKNLSLVRVADFDGDGLADLLVIQPQAESRDGASQRARLDLYGSRGVR
jgi:hypothetical protein